MQNIDFYEGRGVKSTMPAFDRVDPEYFSKTNKIHAKEFEKSRKKTSRALFLIIAMNIITFTVGMVTGLKFAGGAEKVIVDPQTYQAMTDLGRRVTEIVREPMLNAREPAAKVFPRNEYPWVIQVGGEHSHENARAAAQALSKKGHTVILSQSNDKYRVYAGPYKTKTDAGEARSGIIGYGDKIIGSKAEVISR